jgi:hypothetical protein
MNDQEYEKWNEHHKQDIKRKKKMKKSLEADERMLR